MINVNHGASSFYRLGVVRTSSLVSPLTPSNEGTYPLTLPKAFSPILLG